MLETKIMRVWLIFSIVSLSATIYVMPSMESSHRNWDISVNMKANRLNAIYSKEVKEQCRLESFDQKTKKPSVIGMFECQVNHRLKFGDGMPGHRSEAAFLLKDQLKEFEKHVWQKRVKYLVYWLLANAALFILYKLLIWVKSGK